MRPCAGSQKAADEKLQFFSFSAVDRQEFHARSHGVRTSDDGGLNEHGAIVAENVQPKPDDASRRQFRIGLDAAPSDRNLHDCAFRVDVIALDDRGEAARHPLVFSPVEKDLSVAHPGLPKKETMGTELAAKRIDVEDAGEALIDSLTMDSHDVLSGTIRTPGGRNGHRHLLFRAP
jgi:hypothetical protein